MYIPKSMMKAIADNFYDKQVEILRKNESIDAEGGVIVKGYEQTDTFKGNVNFSNCKEIQEEYGLDYEIDISITSATSTNIKISDIIKYDNVAYLVTDVFTRDSHVLIIATKWRQ